MVSSVISCVCISANSRCQQAAAAITLKVLAENGSQVKIQSLRRNYKEFGKKYLCVVATSTTAERIFSTLGLLLTKRRLSFTGDNINKIMFLSDKL